MLYPNLVAEMARCGIAVKDVADKIGRSPDTVNNWLKGKGDFPIGKAFEIQKVFFPTYTIAYLFCKEPIMLNVQGES